MASQNYKISVVLPVSGPSDAFQESLEGLVRQDIGFDSSVQLVLVEYGSPNACTAYAEHFAKQHSSNTLYIRCSSGQLSTALNIGKDHVRGSYVAFLTDGRAWGRSVFSSVVSTFNRCQSHVDIVSVERLHDKSHKKTGGIFFRHSKMAIVDVTLEPDKNVPPLSSCFFKLESIAHHNFDESLGSFEETGFLVEILLEKAKFLSLKADWKSTNNSNNALQIWGQSKTSDDCLYSGLHCMYERLKSIVEARQSAASPFIQRVIMDMLRARFTTPFSSELTDCDRQNALDSVAALLQGIDDEIICTKKGLAAHHKVFALSLKHGRDIRRDFVYDAELDAMVFCGEPVCSIAKSSSILLDFMDVDEAGKLHLEGRFSTALLQSSYNLFLSTGLEELSPIELIPGRQSLYGVNDQELDGSRILERFTFECEISLAFGQSIRFVMKLASGDEICIPMTLGKHFRLGIMGCSYFVSGKFLFRAKKDSILVLNNTWLSLLGCRAAFATEVIRRRKFGVFFYRVAFHIARHFHKREIWLLTDREFKADDNAEHMFRYVVEQNNESIEPYFVLDKESEDYARLSSIGPVIPATSFKHKLYYLLSAKLISSQANEYVVNPFGKSEKYYKDLRSFKFVFLQHGITKDDQSHWLKKCNRDISLLVTAAKPEYESMLSADYYYSDHEVRLTGFPRHDRLLELDRENKPIAAAEKKILLIPTWRKNLAGEYNPLTGERAYSETFRESSYFKFYNALINDQRVLEALRRTGYRMKMCLHPEIVKQCVDFAGNDLVEVNDGFVDYQYEFTTSSLMITDYSSVFFDMAYLRKPVIYTQFDVKDFYAGHTYDKGYFDYEHDGFGPVCYGLDQAVMALVQALESGCQVQPEYMARIEDFYGFHDTDNCKRVYEAILEL